MLVSDEELTAINRAIHTRYGMDFSHYEPTSFKRRVSRVIDKFQLESSLGLWRRMIQDNEFIYTFIDEITVGLTEMFRNSDLWIALRHEVLPGLRTKNPLTVWHAGCSTGEEVYSMAILLTEEHFHNTRLIATDLSNQAIKSAKSGIFSGYYTNTYTANYQTAQGKSRLERYYTLTGEDMTFDKVDLRNVTFLQQNLVKDPVPPHRFDIIFCRNVMIYFDEALKMKVLRLFYDALADGGYFIIGYYDALPTEYKQFFTLENPKIKLYRKAAN